MQCRTNRCGAGVGLLVVIISLLSSYPYTARAANASLTIVAVDGVSHPDVDVLFRVHDDYGRPIRGLTPEAITVIEQGQTIPVELTDLTADDQTQSPVTVALVADQSVFLGGDATAAIRRDIDQLATLLMEQAPTVELALFVPRSERNTTQAMISVPFTTDEAVLRQTVAALEPREGATDLYNTVVTATGASADRAEQRGGSAYVVVFGDGVDKTSIVGSDTAGANEAAQLATQRHVSVVTFGYGKALRQGSVVLSQLADRTGGSYQGTPDGPALASIAQQIHAATAASTYRLHYQSPLGTAAEDRSVTVEVRYDGMTLTADATMTIPERWDRTKPTALVAQVDSRNYPAITLWARPTNQLRQTVPDLQANDFALMLDGTPLQVPLDVAIEPLDVRDEAALQSVALVAAVGGDQGDSVGRLATALLQSPAITTTRVALFMPGVATAEPVFTYDYNALINTLARQADSIGQSTASATLQRAITEVARDADATNRPAQVVFVAATPLPSAEQLQTLNLARVLGVTVHTITPQTVGDGLTRLAQATDGQHLVAPSEQALATFVAQLGQARGFQYRVRFQSPLVADQKEHRLTLQVGGRQAAETIAPVVLGEASIAAPFSNTNLAVLFGLGVLLLLASAVGPRTVADRRLRCSACGRVRRKAWGTNCLFCEQQALHGAPDQVQSDLWASLHQPRATQSGAQLPLLEPGSAQHAAPPAIQVPRTPVAPPTHAPVAPTAEQVRATTHTDFWGPLPNEPATASLDQASAPRHSPLPAPPPLPVFTTTPATACVSHTRHYSAEAYEPVHRAFWGALPVADPQPGTATIAHTSASQVAPVSHTDFWGTLPSTELLSDED